MNLFSLNRPYLPSGQRAWSRGDIAISNLELFPKDSGEIEVSIYLPLKEAKFKSKKFSIVLPPDELPILIHEFILDPETFCEENFLNPGDIFKPDLRNEEIKEKKPSNPTNHTASSSQLKNLIL